MPPIETADIETIVKLALDNNMDGVWKELYKFIHYDPTFGYVEHIAAREGWGREKLATVLAAALLVRSEDWRGVMNKLAELAAQQPPAPIIARENQIVYLPGPEHRGPGC